MIRQSFNDGWSFRPLIAEPQGPNHPVPVALPHDAVIGTPRDPDRQLVGTGYFSGGAWEYTRTLDAPESWRGRAVSLEFEAVYRSPSVYVNGDLAGHGASGYGGFVVEIDPFLRFGQSNEIRVEARAHRDSRWYSGGGITRPVWLLVGDHVHIQADGVVVTTPDIDADAALVCIDTTIENVGRATTTRRLETRILDPEGVEVAVDRTPVTVFGGEGAVVHQRVLVPAPALWSVDSPHIYRVALRLLDGEAIVDECEVTFGIRSLSVDPLRGLRINGETVKLRGACVHHDSGVLGAATFDRAEERRIELLKEAGFNAVRSAHQPLSRAALAACDRVGMLVMDELTDMWTRPKHAFDAALAFPDSWRTDLAAMVRKDRNHPSVVLYSIGNEIPEIGTGAGAAWARRLATETRRLDPTRLVTSGVNGALLVIADTIDGDPELLGEWASAEVSEINTMMAGLADRLNALGVSSAVSALTEETLATLDVAGFNYLDSRYDLDRTLFPHRVIVGSETFPTRIDELWAAVTAHDHVIGDFTWTGWDYLGEAGIGRPHYQGVDSAGGALADYPWGTAWVGDLDITGRRRPASFYREIVYGLRSRPYLAVRNPASFGLEPAPAPWSWSDSISSWNWAGSDGAPIEVEVYSDADEVELFVDGESAGRLPAGRAHRFRAVFAVTYRPGRIEAVAIRGGEPGERTELRTAGPAGLVARADRDRVSAAGDDLVYVDVDLADETGVLATDREDEVTVSIDGPGMLQGFGSASPHNEQSYVGATHRTFRGHVLAVVRPVGEGRIVVSARSEAHGSAEVSVDAISDVVGAAAPDAAG